MTFKEGLKDGLPIGLGYLSVSFAFGIFATSSGLSYLEALFISMSNLTSAGQLAGVPIIIGGGSLLEMASTQLVINLRYALMSVGISQKLAPSVSFIDRFWIAFINTDEIYAVSSSKKGELNRPYLFGLAVLPYLGWQAGTLIGGILGDILPAILINSLTIAIYGMFIAIVVPVCRKEKATLYCVLISVALSCLFYYLTEIPSGFVIILCALISAGIMSVVAPYQEVEHEV